MKLLFTKPKNWNDITTNKALMWAHSWEMGNLLSSYLRYKEQIYIGKNNHDFKVNYNFVYDFYIIILYEIPGNLGNPKKHWNEVINFLKKDNIKFENKGHTWRWENHKQIDDPTIKTTVS